MGGKASFCGTVMTISGSRLHEDTPFSSMPHEHVVTKICLDVPGEARRVRQRDPVKFLR